MMRQTKLSKTLGKLHKVVQSATETEYDIAIVSYPGETEVTDFYDYAEENFTVQDALDEWAEDHEGSVLELYNTNANGDIVIMDIPGEGVQKATLPELKDFMESIKEEAESHKEDDPEWYEQEIEIYNLYEVNKDDLTAAIDKINNTDYAMETGFYIHGLYDSKSGHTMIIPEQ